MKNIPYEKLLEVATMSSRTSMWMDIRNLVHISRLELGLSSALRGATRYVGDVKKAREVATEWLSQRNYITMPSQGASTQGLIGVLNHPTEDHVISALQFDLGDETASIAICGDLAEIQECREWFMASYSERGALLTTVDGLDERKNLIKTRKYVPKDQAQVAHQSFYPWLSISLAEYFDEFMKSDEAVLVLFGPPGTGKSTFLRSLIAHGSYDAWLAYNKEVVESPRVINQFFNSSAKILAYEDIDNYLGSREDGNQLMSSILNASEGILQHPGKKIVFSTNLSSIDRIDPALLRVGRCFDILKFELLSAHEAATVRIEMDMEARDFSSKDKWSLSEALVKHSVAQQTINRFGRKTGFL